MRPGRLVSSLARKRIWLWSAPLVWLGCGGGSTDVVLPALNVMTETQGLDLDPDGYQLAVDANPNQPIGLNDTLVVEQLPDGEHTLGLAGLAPNCTAGENPRTITVRSGTTANTEFTVVCTATTASLEIQVTVTGSGTDADGFVALLDGTDQGSIFPGPPASLPNVGPGSHTVGLSGLAANCRVLGDNPVSITVQAGDDREVPFTVDCTPPPAASGTLQITTTTTGSDLDADGYSVQVDAGTAQPIGDNAIATLINLSAGQHSVRLLGMAANCALTGANPEEVSVPSGGTATVAFALTCTPIAPSTGGIQVSVTTSGSSPDPDGYSLSVDGGAGQTVQVNGSRAIVGLAAGSHSVQLADVATNCAVGGDNPQTVAVTAGQNTPVTFAVTCTEPPTQTGGIRISVATTGSGPDPDGYTVSIDAGSLQAIGVNGSRTISNLAVGAHSVQLGGLAANCTVTGNNPLSVTVADGQNAAATFAVTCSATTGGVKVTASTTGTQPDPDGYQVSLDGGTARTITANGTTTFEALQPGDHPVQLSGLAANCSVPSPSQTATVVAGQTASVTFEVSCPATGPSVNLRIERMYITQSTQTASGDVPLVAGRDGYVRVFVTASAANSPRPDVRVRLYQNGSPTATKTLTLPGFEGFTPTDVQEGNFSSSWNVLLSGADIQPNTRIIADVDPDNAISEPDEGDNLFPASGSPQQLTVQSVPTAHIRFVPILQSGNGLTGTVGNASQMVDRTRRMYPLRDIQTDVHQVYTTKTNDVLQQFDDNHAWTTILEELNALRVYEGASQTYFGMVKVTYGPGINGIGYVGVPTAMGSDDPAELQRVVAHELGHTWGRWHSPCGNPGGLDPNHLYPYRDGQIGVYGLDVPNKQVKDPSQPDIMSYCPNEWISDYTYRNVLEFRGSAQSIAGSGTVGPSILVWGHIENGRAVLEPGFQMVTRSSLPTRPGPYTLEGRAADGSRLFAFSFQTATVADGSNRSEQFAFAVPLDPDRAAQLQSISLNGPGGQATTTASAAAARVNGAAASNEVSVEPESQGVVLKWNAQTHPMIMVRDPETGQVLSFARGGTARVWTQKRQIDLEVSNGVTSHRLRRAISR